MTTKCPYLACKPDHGCTIKLIPEETDSPNVRMLQWQDSSEWFELTKSDLKGDLRSATLAINDQNWQMVRTENASDSKTSNIDSDFHTTQMDGTNSYSLSLTFKLLLIDIDIQTPLDSIQHTVDNFKNKRCQGFIGCADYSTSCADFY